MNAAAERDAPLNHILRLKKWAKRLRVSDDDLEDVAMSAYLRGLECGVPHWHFTSVCLKNVVLTKRRNERRRRALSLDDDDILEMKKLYTRDCQVEQVTFGETMAFIATLKPQYQKSLKLAGLGFDADEMARILAIPKKDIYWHLQRGRQLLRDRGLYEVSAKGSSKYVGVRREGHKWNASIRVDGKFHYLGSFETADGAALAYETAAGRLGRTIRKKKGSR